MILCISEILSSVLTLNLNSPKKCQKMSGECQQCQQWDHNYYTIGTVTVSLPYYCNDDHFSVQNEGRKRFLRFSGGARYAQPPKTVVHAPLARDE
jgi:hypothetical protein